MNKKELFECLSGLSQTNNSRDGIDIRKEEANIIVNEIERLNNIIDELEKWLIIQHDIYKNIDKEENTRLSCQYLKVKDKLQELKGSDK